MSSRPQSLISAVNRYRLEGEQVAQILEPRVEMASMMDALAQAAYPRRRLGRRLTLTRGAQVQIRLKSHTRCREPTDRSASSAVDEGIVDNETSLCQVLGGLLLRRGLWPVLAGVKVVPAGARGGAGPGGAPPGRRLRCGWFGAF